MGDRGVEYTFSWCIQDYNYFFENVEFQSPVFRADGLQGTSWRLKVYPWGKRDECKGYISLYLGRDWDNDGPEEISVNYELSTLAADGLSTHSKVAKRTFEKSMVCGWPKFVEIKKISQDNLIMCARVWKGEGKVRRFAPLSARCRIPVENVFFLQVVEDFSALRPNQKKIITINPGYNKWFIVSSNLYFSDDPRHEGEIFVEIASSDRSHILCKRKISLLDAFGNIVLCTQNDNRFDADRRNIQNLPLLLTRKAILNKKREYLTDDRLSLLCECAFASEKMEEIKNVELEMSEEIENVELEMLAEAEKEAGALEGDSGCPRNDYSSALFRLWKSAETGRRVECTLLWIIEKFGFCSQKIGERLQSPDFKVHEFEGTCWSVILYPKGKTSDDYGITSLYFGRNRKDNGPGYLCLNYELSVLDAKGSILFSEADYGIFRRNKFLGWNDFLNIEFFSPAVLIVRCKIWKGEGVLHQVPPICARTRIAVENVSFHHVVENFSTLKLHQQNTVEIESESEKSFNVSCTLYTHDDIDLVGDMIFEITSSDSSHILCKRKISLLDASGKIVECGEKDNQFCVDRINIEKVPFPLKSQTILDHKNKYLLDDKLTLFCECAFITGFQFHKIGEVQPEILEAAEKEAGAEQIAKGISSSTKQTHSMEETAETERYSLDCSLKYKIEDFSTADGEICNSHVENRHSFSFNISVSVFPNGTDENDEGWLVVRPEVKSNESNLLKACVSLCTMNIIDIEGNYRFPRYFETSSHNLRDDKSSNFKNAKYLEKSFILKSADELTSGGVLVLKCDILVDFYVKERKRYILNQNFLDSIPKSVIVKERAAPGDKRGSIIVYDFTSQILTLPRFHESRKRFGVYDIPPAESMKVSKADNADSLEDIWIFDTCGSRCLLSIAPRPGNVGRLLVEASPVMERCINAPMKEGQEKRVDLSHVVSGAFLLVLHFLESGELSTDKFRHLMYIYKFSHLYEIEDLQRECAKRLVESIVSGHQIEQIKRRAYLHSDEYLLNLLKTRLPELF